MTSLQAGGGEHRATQLLLLPHGLLCSNSGAQSVGLPHPPIQLSDCPLSSPSFTVGPGNLTEASVLPRAYKSLLLSVLRENEELPNQPMQIYAKEMRIKNLRVHHLKPVWVPGALPSSCSAGFIQICECGSDCVYVKVRHRNAEQEDREGSSGGPRGVRGRIWLHPPFHRKA